MEKMNNLKKIAIIGGETHIAEVTQLAGTRLQIVGAAVRHDQMEMAKRQFGGVVTTDFRALLDETKPDIAAVANENDRKAEVCLEALRRGISLVVDKPLALTMEDTKAIRETAKKVGKSVLLLLTLRGDPQYRKVREIVRSGRIGEPVQMYQKMSVMLKAESRPPWFLDRRRAGGPILDLAIHGVDQFEWVSGVRLSEVTSHEANISHPEMKYLTDSGVMFFRLENGGTALMEQNRLMPPGTGSDYRLRVVGTGGQVDLRMGKYLWVETKAGREDFDVNALDDAVSVVENWLDAMENGEEPLVTDEVGYRANEICCLAVQSANTQKTVKLP